MQPNSHQPSFPDATHGSTDGRFEELSTDRCALQDEDAGPRASADDSTGLPDAEFDEDLLLRFQLGEHDAFDAIVTQFQAPLTRFFYRLCWDRDRAEDFAQDVFLKLLRGSASYKPQGKLSTFLFRIATNRWIDHYRSRKPRPKLYSLDQGDSEEEQPLVRKIHAEAIDPLADVDKNEERGQLRQALQQISMPHRLVFELAVYQGLPYAEISELLEIPEGTVKSRMHNTVKALRDLVGKQRVTQQTETETEETDGFFHRPTRSRRAASSATRSHRNRTKRRLA